MVCQPCCHYALWDASQFRSRWIYNTTGIVILFFHFILFVYFYLFIYFFIAIGICCHLCKTFLFKNCRKFPIKLVQNFPKTFYEEEITLNSLILLTLLSQNPEITCSSLNTCHWFYENFYHWNGKNCTGHTILGFSGTSFSFQKQFHRWLWLSLIISRTLVQLSLFYKSLGWPSIFGRL